MPITSTKTNSQSGVSLIEILVALFVLSIGLLGLAAMQVKALQFNQSAQMRTQATILAYDIIDRMRANRTVLNDYTVEGSAADTHQCEQATAICTPSRMANADLGHWIHLVENRLPGGSGEITSNDNSSIYTVTISWTDRDNTLKSFDMQAAL